MLPFGSNNHNRDGRRGSSDVNERTGASGSGHGGQTTTVEDSLRGIGRGIFGGLHSGLKAVGMGSFLDSKATRAKTNELETTTVHSALKGPETSEDQYMHPRMVLGEDEEDWSRETAQDVSSSSSVNEYSVPTVRQTSYGDDEEATRAPIMSLAGPVGRQESLPDPQDLLPSTTEYLDIGRSQSYGSPMEPTSRSASPPRSQAPAREKLFLSDDEDDGGDDVEMDFLYPSETSVIIPNAAPHSLDTSLSSPDTESSAIIHSSRSSPQSLPRSQPPSSTLQSNIPLFRAKPKQPHHGLLPLPGRIVHEETSISSIASVPTPASHRTQTVTSPDRASPEALSGRSERGVVKEASFRGRKRRKLDYGGRREVTVESLDSPRSSVSAERKKGGAPHAARAAKRGASQEPSVISISSAEDDDSDSQSDVSPSKRRPWLRFSESSLGESASPVGEPRRSKASSSWAQKAPTLSPRKRVRRGVATASQSESGPASNSGSDTDGEEQPRSLPSRSRITQQPTKLTKHSLSSSSHKSPKRTMATPVRRILDDESSSSSSSHFASDDEDSAVETDVPRSKQVSRRSLPVKVGLTAREKGKGRAVFSSDDQDEDDTRVVGKSRDKGKGKAKEDEPPPRSGKSQHLSSRLSSSQNSRSTAAARSSSIIDLTSEKSRSQPKTRTFTTPSEHFVCVLVPPFPKGMSAVDYERMDVRDREVGARGRAGNGSTSPHKARQQASSSVSVAERSREVGPPTIRAASSRQQSGPQAHEAGPSSSKAQAKVKAALPRPSGSHARSYQAAPRSPSIASTVTVVPHSPPPSSLRPPDPLMSATSWPSIPELSSSQHIAPTTPTPQATPRSTAARGSLYALPPPGSIPSYQTHKTPTDSERLQASRNQDRERAKAKAKERKKERERERQEAQENPGNSGAFNLAAAYNDMYAQVDRAASKKKRKKQSEGSEDVGRVNRQSGSSTPAAGAPLASRATAIATHKASTARRPPRKTVVSRPLTHPSPDADPELEEADDDDEEIEVSVVQRRHREHELEELPNSPKIDPPRDPLSAANVARLNQASAIPVHALSPSRQKNQDRTTRFIQEDIQSKANANARAPVTEDKSGHPVHYVSEDVYFDTMSAATRPRRDMPPPSSANGLVNSFTHRRRASVEIEVENTTRPPSMVLADSVLTRTTQESPGSSSAVAPTLPLYSHANAWATASGEIPTSSAHDLRPPSGQSPDESLSDCSPLPSELGGSAKRRHELKDSGPQSSTRKRKRPLGDTTGRHIPSSSQRRKIKQQRGLGSRIHGSATKRRRVDSDQSDDDDDSEVEVVEHMSSGKATSRSSVAQAGSAKSTIPRRPTGNRRPLGAVWPPAASQAVSGSSQALSISENSSSQASPSRTKAGQRESSLRREPVQAVGSTARPASSQLGTSQTSRDSPCTAHTGRSITPQPHPSTVYATTPEPIESILISAPISIPDRKFLKAYVRKLSPGPSRAHGVIHGKTSDCVLSITVNAWDDCLAILGEEEPSTSGKARYREGEIWPGPSFYSCEQHTHDDGHYITSDSLQESQAGNSAAGYQKSVKEDTPVASSRSRVVEESNVVQEDDDLASFKYQQAATESSAEPPGGDLQPFQTPSRPSAKALGKRRAVESNGVVTGILSAPASPQHPFSEAPFSLNTETYINDAIHEEGDWLHEPEPQYAKGSLQYPIGTKTQGEGPTAQVMSESSTSNGALFSPGPYIHESPPRPPDESGEEAAHMTSTTVPKEYLVKQLEKIAKGCGYQPPSTDPQSSGLAIFQFFWAELDLRSELFPQAPVPDSTPFYPVQSPSQPRTSSYEETAIIALRPEASNVFFDEYSRGTTSSLTNDAESPTFGADEGTPSLAGSAVITGTSTSLSNLPSVGDHSVSAPASSAGTAQHSAEVHSTTVNPSLLTGGSGAQVGMTVEGEGKASNFPPPVFWSRARRKSVRERIPIRFPDEDMHVASEQGDHSPPYGIHTTQKGRDDSLSLRIVLPKPSRNPNSPATKVGPPKRTSRANWPEQEQDQAFCHMCRSRSAKLTMTCAGSACTKAFCIKCIYLRDMIKVVKFTTEPQKCPACLDLCNCDACCAKRGQTYVRVNKTSQERLALIAQSWLDLGLEAPITTQSAKGGSSGSGTKLKASKSGLSSRSSRPSIAHEIVPARVTGPDNSFFATMYDPDGQPLRVVYQRNGQFCMSEHPTCDTDVPDIASPPRSPSPLRTGAINADLLSQEELAILPTQTSSSSKPRSHVFIGRIQPHWRYDANYRPKVVDPIPPRKQSAKGEVRRLFVGSRAPLFRRYPSPTPIDFQDDSSSAALLDNASDGPQTEPTAPVASGLALDEASIREALSRALESTACG